MTVRKKKKKPLYLSTVFLCSAICCAMVSFFGPFSWKIYSIEGLVYFFAVEGVFYVGLLCGRNLILRERDVKPTGKRERPSSQSFALLLSAVSILSILCCLYLLISFRTFYGSSYQFGEASYEFADEGRGLFEKICTVLMQFGMASYLLGLSCGCNQQGMRKLISIVGFWTTAAYYTVGGSRFTLVVGLIVFLVANRREAITSFRKVGEYAKGGFSKILAISLALVVVCAIGVITNTRMNVEARAPQNHYEFVLGDSPLKEEWTPLASAMGTLGNAAFSLFDYVGESPFVFSKYYNDFMPDKVYWAENSLRAVGQFLRPLGIDAIHSQSSIYSEIGGGTGKYSGFVYVLMVDFGVLLAPFVAFLVGFSFSKVERHRGSSPLMAALYPCVVTAVVFAPIYYFYVGRLDFVVFGILVLQVFWVPLCKEADLSALRAIETNESNLDSREIFS